MRALFDTYPWAFDVPGGGERQLLAYAEYLPTLGIDVLLHDTWHPEFGAVDLVHFFSCMGGSVHACGYVHRRGLPLVISSSLWISEGHSYPLMEIRDQLDLADVVVTNSRLEAELLAQVFDFPAERFMPIFNGVDARFLHPGDGTLFRRRFGIEGPFLANVANVERRKNQLNLVRALSPDMPPLIIIGHIRDRDYAAQVVAEGGSRVRMLGPLDHHDPALASAYASCSAFVLPSVLETPGLAALEAAAAGAPLVVTKVGSTTEYFSDLVSYVQPGDPEDIGLGVLRALERGHGPDLQQRVADRFLWSKVLAAAPDIYKCAVARSRQRLTAQR